MEENQTNQNLNQQPVQSQTEQVQQPVQQQSAEQPSVSMQIQQLLVQQQQYQKQYNDLVDYVKKTPNLPLDQVNQIKVQLDQLNALFFLFIQKLQALWYNQVQVNKPTEVKKWAKNNFSFKKLAIGCWVVLFLILVGFFVTLTSLIRNPYALQWIWIDALTAKSILQVFTALLFGSIVLLMIWVIVWNIYRLITVKNQSKIRYLLWLLWWIFWTIVFWVLMWVTFMWIGRIVTEEVVIDIPMVQPYLVGKVLTEWKDEFNFPYDVNKILGKDYPLVAPSEFAFKIRALEVLKYQRENLWANTTLQSLTLICGNPQDQRLELSWNVDQLQDTDMMAFKWRCLYGQKWKYKYSLEMIYKDNIRNEIMKNTVTFGAALDFKSEVLIYSTLTNSSSSNNKTSRVYPTKNVKWEFLLWKAPAKVTVDTTQVFRDFGLGQYNVIWDMDWDLKTDRENQVVFDYSYRVPQVYYPSVKFSDLGDWDFIYSFPVRVEQNELPICWIELTGYQWTTVYQISTQFLNPADSTKISSYQYTIKNAWTKKAYQVLKNSSQEVNYTFPEQWAYSVVLDYVTVDKKQWRCESDVIQMKKEAFDVQYAILALNNDTWKFKELCNSKSTTYGWCRQITLDTVPQSYQIQIKSVTPNSNTLKKVVTLDDKPLLNENDTYTFDIPNEWVYNLKIEVSDDGRLIDKKIIDIKFTAKKQDIVWKVVITTDDRNPNDRVPVSEWFEPLSVIIDASKTEVNVEWDEIIYFTWDFGDGEVKRNQQNWVVAHTYNYDYARENWIFQPIVSIRTRNWIEKTIYWPKLNVKKWLISVDITSTSHPSRQAQVWKDVTFAAEFDWLPERMTWDFGDWTDPITCKWRTCTEISHAFEETWLFSVKLSLEFDAVQQVDGTMDFKVY